MQYGRNIDVDLPDDGTEQYVAIKLDETHESVPDGRSALEHATDGNLANDVYNDGTAQ